MLERKRRVPVYRHPPFVTETEEYRTTEKRYWLKLQISSAPGSLLVILKNPSRASKEFSDKTIYTLTNYVDRNRRNYEVLADVGLLTIVNLIPLYETDSRALAKRNVPLIDTQNITIIDRFAQAIPNVLLAWGNPPIGMDHEYRELAERVTILLKNNENRTYYVDRISKSGYPKHAQVWGYANALNKLVL